MRQDALGISLKSLHYNDLLSHSYPVDFLEGHIENYLEGGYHLDVLKRLSQKYDITLHGVGLSLGSTDAPLQQDIQIRKKIIDIIQPAYFSEHAAWTRCGNSHLNDLLPLPLNGETSRRLADHADKVQNILGRQILLENLSSYITFPEDDMSEAEFMNDIAQKSGCGILLDINNIYVQEHNLGRSAISFLKSIDKKAVMQYHLAGGEFFEDSGIIVDTHGTDVPKDVLELYRVAIDIIGMRPTLYERDNNIPGIDDMMSQLQSIKKTINIGETYV
ncbi:MAG: DUF692 domain-containing protein [Pseudomonadota bacterium]